jgi:hypothetical protein
LRGERRARLRPAPDRHFHHRIMAQGIVIDAVFVAAADPEHARFDDLAQPMADARRIAPVPQRRGKPGKDAGLLLGATQQQHAGVRRLVAAIEIDCEFLGANRWQLEGKWRSVGHGCGARWYNAARRINTDLLRDLKALRYSHTIIAHPWCIIRARTAPGHLLPVVVRKTRQLDTRKPPVMARNVTPAGVPPKAASRGQAERGQDLTAL